MNHSLIAIDEDLDVFKVQTKVVNSDLAGSTRIIAGKTFDEALDGSLASYPEEGFIIASAAKWDRARQSWVELALPSF